MDDRLLVEPFLETYRTAFARSDAGALADLFSYPCLLTGAGNPVTVTAVASRGSRLRKRPRRRPRLPVAPARGAAARSYTTPRAAQA